MSRPNYIVTELTSENADTKDLFAEFTIEYADTKELFAKVVITTTGDDRLRLDARVKCEYDCELLCDLILNPQDHPDFNVYELS